MKKLFVTGMAVCALILTGCQTTTERVLDSGEDTQTQMQKRNYQSRSFDTSDKAKVLNAAISTIQDFGFIITKADYTLGSVTAERIQNSGSTAMTVITRKKGKDQIVVRTNIQFDLKPVENPKIYQDFYNALSKSLFLQANNVD